MIPPPRARVLSPYPGQTTNPANRGILSHILTSSNNVLKDHKKVTRVLESRRQVNNEWMRFGRQGLEDILLRQHVLDLLKADNLGFLEHLDGIAVLVGFVSSEANTPE